MAESNRCPQCGAEVPGDAPQGLCPNCVLKAGFGTEQTESIAAAGSGSASAGSSEARFVPPTPAELAPHFPDLEILALVGQGGMGVVYKARQKRLDRLVALKILSPKIGQSPAFAERFAREARAMAMLNHPHVVAVYDSGQTDSSLAQPGGGAMGEGGFYYFLMEFVDGLTLRQLLDAGKLAPEEALAIVPQICEALQYAHDHGVVHRDIKPENVLLDKEGRVKIADFGIAKLVGGEAKDLTLTGADQVVGTPHYMAPEQIEHPLQVDHRADIYSLGVVFYQMLTGELPIGRFAPPSKKVQIDVRLDEVVLRALEKEPELRYQQASEIKSRVETIVTTPGALPAEPTAHEKMWQSPTTGWGYLVGQMFGITFTSPLAFKLANFSALGFLCFLGFMPLPEWNRCFGFSGLFGLIGAAFLIEMIGGSNGGHAAASRRRLVVVGQRGGKAVINWPGVLLILAITLTVSEVFVILTSLIVIERIAVLPLFTVFISVLAGNAAIIFVRRFVTPVERLTPLDKPIATAPQGIPNPPEGARPAAIAVLRWTARILGTLMLLGMALIFIGEGMPYIPAQPAGVRVEFVGFFLIALGMAIGWKWEGWATLLIVAGEAEFHVVEGKLVLPGALNLPWIVAALYGVCWCLERFPAAIRRTASAAIVCGILLLVLARLLFWLMTTSTHHDFGGGPSNASVQPLSSFGTADKLITKDGITVDQDAWRIEAEGNRIVQLFEIPALSMDDCQVIFRAKLKTENLQGRAYLELWRRMPNGGEYSSKGLESAVTGTTDWSACESHFFVKKGERPDLIKVNLIIEGRGTIWMKDTNLGKVSRTPGTMIEPPALGPRSAETDSHPRPMSPALGTANVASGHSAQTISTSGTIEAEEVVGVGTEAEGMIVSFGADPRGDSDPSYKDKTIDDGSPVEKGTILARIDDALYKARLDQQKAGCARVDAELTVVRAKAKGQTPEVAKAAVAAAEAASVQAKAALKEAEIHLDRTIIRSPVKGWVIARRISVGQTAATGSSLFLIAKDTGKVQVRASVGQMDSGRIRKGMEATFTVQGLPSNVFKGTVTGIRLNGVARYTVIVEAENPNRKLMPSQTANVQFKIAAKTGADQTSSRPRQISAAQADPLQSPSAAEMRAIVLAGLEYATEHSQWPKTLDELKPKYLDAGKIDLGQFVYHPLSAESVEENPLEVVVLSEKEPAFAGGQLVGFADGYVEFIPSQR